jgi:uncharacterized protein YkwD
MLERRKNNRKINTLGDDLSEWKKIEAEKVLNFFDHLKNFFVAHEGNNHRPHSLRPKRIVFHLAAAALIKTIAVVFILLFPMSAWLTPEISAAQSKKIIALTNSLRRERSAPSLVENSLLDQAAYQKAQDMMIKQYFAHVSPENKDLDFFLSSAGYKYSVAGENLAMGFTDANEVMNAWRDSPTHYANLVDPDFKEIGVAMTDGIFKGTETTLAAQYFGRPNGEAPQIARVERKTFKIQTTPAKATIAVSAPVGKKERVIMATANLPVDTKSATVVMGEKKIELEKTSTTTWSGSQIVTENDYNKNTKPVILADINSTDASNTITVASVANQDIKPQKISLTDQYLLLKANPNKSMQKVMDVSSFYFFFLLMILVVSLIINLVLRLEKRHPSLVVGGVTLAAVLLIFLII